MKEKDVLELTVTQWSDSIDIDMKYKYNIK